MLEVRNVSKYFGGLAAVRDVSFEVRPNDIVGLIGPNGAGKTTLFNVISGFQRADSGKVVFQKREITHYRPHQICRLGIARTFQIVRPFLDATVLENVLVGAVFGRSERVSISDARQEARRVLEFVGILDRQNILARNLTLPERRTLEIAKALVTKPKLLLIDEFIAGLNESEMLEAMDLIKEIWKSGITIVWVEHVMRAIMNVCERIIVLHHGEKIAEGRPEEVANEPKVIDAYLGESTA